MLVLEAALAAAVMALVGEIVAFNTIDFIFYYPFSINFVDKIFAAAQGLSSLIVQIGDLAVFIPTGMLRFKKMDI